MNDKKTADIYANVFLAKAKSSKDPINIADGYVYKSYMSEFEDALKYSDSIILTTKEMNHPYYPGLGHMLKGYFNYNAGKDKLALACYLKANEYAVKTNNIKQQIEIQQFLGVIMLNMGDYSASLKIHEEQLKFIENQPEFKSNFKEDYLLILDNLSKGYIRADRPDSALTIIKKGIEFSILNDRTNFYYSFLLNSGNALYLKNEVNKALDSLNKAIPHLDDVSLAMCYYYKGKIYKKSDYQKAIGYFTKVDSIYESTKIPFIELREVYKTMFDYYSEKENIHEQLNSVNKLIKVDSILDTNSQYLSALIVKDYEIPKLHLEKERLTKEIQNNKSYSKTIYAILIIALITLSLIGFIFYKKQIKYRIRYQKLISENTKTYIPVKIEENKIADPSIPEIVITDILSKLKIFEENNCFTNNKVTLNKLAKDFKTNSSYLSKIINQYKNSSFSNYINDLRIQYAMGKLKQNPQFRNYTIKAISEDVGFNNAESFSKAFYKKTEIYPSFFIKQLNKDYLKK